MNAFHTQPPHDDDDPSQLAHAGAADERHDGADHLADHLSVLGMLQIRGEQPADAALSRRLETDAALRDEANALAQLDGMLRGMVARSGGGDVSVATSDRALQASLRLMREQALLRRQNGGAQRHRRRSMPNVPRWAWATAAAAAIAVGFAFWSASTDPGTQLATLLPGINDNTDNGSVGTGAPGLESDNATEIQKQIDALNFIAQTGDTGDAGTTGLDADPSASDPN